MISISCLESKLLNNNNWYGRFQLAPFQKGEGLTVANALRRTLLAEKSNFFITWVDFYNAKIPYSVLTGMRESIFDILLNLKQVIFTSDMPTNRYALDSARSRSSAWQGSKLLSPSIPFTISAYHADESPTYTGYICAKGPAIISAKNIKLPKGLKCVDPDRYIVTLADDGLFYLRFALSGPMVPNDYTSAIVHHAALLPKKLFNKEIQLRSHCFSKQSKKRPGRIPTRRGPTPYNNEALTRYTQRPLPAERWAGSLSALPRLLLTNDFIKQFNFQNTSILATTQKTCLLNIQIKHYYYKCGRFDRFLYERVKPSKPHLTSRKDEPSLLGRIPFPTPSSPLARKDSSKRQGASLCQYSLSPEQIRCQVNLARKRILPHTAFQQPSRKPFQNLLTFLGGQKVPTGFDNHQLLESPSITLRRRFYPSLVSVASKNNYLSLQCYTHIRASNDKAWTFSIISCYYFSKNHSWQKSPPSLTENGQKWSDRLREFYRIKGKTVWHSTISKERKSFTRLNFFGKKKGDRKRPQYYFSNAVDSLSVQEPVVQRRPSGPQQVQAPTTTNEALPESLNNSVVLKPIYLNIEQILHILKQCTKFRKNQRIYSFEPHGFIPPQTLPSRLFASQAKSRKRKGIPLTFLPTKTGVMDKAKKKKAEKQAGLFAFLGSKGKKRVPEQALVQLNEKNACSGTRSEPLPAPAGPHDFRLVSPHLSRKRSREHPCSTRILLHLSARLHCIKMEKARICESFPFRTKRERFQLNPCSTCTSTSGARICENRVFSYRKNSYFQLGGRTVKSPGPFGQARKGFYHRVQHVFRQQTKPQKINIYNSKISFTLRYTYPFKYTVFETFLQFIDLQKETSSPYCLPERPYPLARMLPLSQTRYVQYNECFKLYTNRHSGPEYTPGAIPNPIRLVGERASLVRVENNWLPQNSYKSFFPTRLFTSAPRREKEPGRFPSTTLHVTKPWNSFDTADSAPNYGEPSAWLGNTINWSVWNQADTSSTMLKLSDKAPKKSLSTHGPSTKIALNCETKTLGSSVRFLGFPSAPKKNREKLSAYERVYQVPVYGSNHSELPTKYHGASWWRIMNNRNFNDAFIIIPTYPQAAPHQRLEHPSLFSRSAETFHKKGKIRKSSVFLYSYKKTEDFANQLRERGRFSKEAVFAKAKAPTPLLSYFPSSSSLGINPTSRLNQATPYMHRELVMKRNIVKGSPLLNSVYCANQQPYSKADELQLWKSRFGYDFHRQKQTQEGFLPILWSSGRDKQHPFEHYKNFLWNSKKITLRILTNARLPLVINRKFSIPTQIPTSKWAATRDSLFNRIKITRTNKEEAYLLASTNDNPSENHQRKAAPSALPHAWLRHKMMATTNFICSKTYPYALPNSEKAEHLLIEKAKGSPFNDQGKGPSLPETPKKGEKTVFLYAISTRSDLFLQNLVNQVGPSAPFGLPPSPSVSPGQAGKTFISTPTEIQGKVVSLARNTDHYWQKTTHFAILQRWKKQKLTGMGALSYFSPYQQDLGKTEEKKRATLYMQIGMTKQEISLVKWLGDRNIIESLYSKPSRAEKLQSEKEALEPYSHEQYFGNPIRRQSTKNWLGFFTITLPAQFCDNSSSISRYHNQQSHGRRSRLFCLKLCQPGAERSFGFYPVSIDNSIPMFLTENHDSEDLGIRKQYRGDREKESGWFGLYEYYLAKSSVFLTRIKPKICEGKPGSVELVSLPQVSADRVRVGSKFLGSYPNTDAFPGLSVSLRPCTAKKWRKNGSMICMQLSSSSFKTHKHLLLNDNKTIVPPTFEVSHEMISYFTIKERAREPLVGQQASSVTEKDPALNLIHKVNYIVESQSVGSSPYSPENENEYIQIDIWTNGSLSPRQALLNAFKKLFELFYNLSKYNCLKPLEI